MIDEMYSKEGEILITFCFLEVFVAFGLILIYESLLK